MEPGVMAGPVDVRGVLKSRFKDWVRRRIPASRRVLLGHRNIFILPSRQGLVFCLVLLLMFVAAINYQTSLAFALVFLLAGMFLMSILHTFRNLAGLRLSAVCGEGVFAGEAAPVTVILERRDKHAHEALDIRFEQGPPVRGDLVEGQEARLTLYVPAPRRGRFSPGRLTVSTVFPFGLCRAWSPVDLAVEGLVWPRPEPCDPRWLLDHWREDERGSPSAGQDDFQGLCEYRPGDSLRRVAWKHFARGQGMFVKQFAGQFDDELWLDWEMFTGQDTETRLSRLCWCSLQLRGGTAEYGLRLPGRVIAPARGAEHFRQVMEALALFGDDGGAGAARA